MSWFNYIGLIIIAVIMIPNVVFAMTNKDGFENEYKNLIFIKKRKFINKIIKNSCIIEKMIIKC